MLTIRGLDRVLGGLASLGYDAEWGVLGAADVGAPHQRDRIWVVAYTVGEGGKRRRKGGICTDGIAGRAASKWGSEVVKVARCGESVADADSERLEKLDVAAKPDQARQHTGGVAEIGRGEWWATEPAVGRVAHGVAARVDRLRALGNGQVPLCAAEAWHRLTARFAS